MPGTIIFNGIYVNSQGPNGAVFVGEASAPGWDSHNKNQTASGQNNIAFGSVDSIAGNLFLFSDNDFLDTLILDGFERDGGPSIQS
ncbi:hypothetical protein D7M11_00060 [Paenibacillus ginsengarvi]|uniref:Spore germination protein n=1 Tax=Paenibacillus ginsengarvi TaxID=400777 RepID=A0A3B0CMK0_9BACL|nr:hypothetical protein D7M11_00060 [Paenibacillus ginsengarvi]